MVEGRQGVAVDLVNAAAHGVVAGGDGLDVAFDLLHELHVYALARAQLGQVRADNLHVALVDLVQALESVAVVLAPECALVADACAAAVAKD